MGSRADHRGRIVRTAHPSILDLVRTGPRPPIPRSIGFPAVRLALPVVRKAIYAFMGLLAIAGYIATMPGGLILAVLLLCMGVVILFLFLFDAEPKIDWELWFAHILGAGHCPSCGYTLLGLSAEEDGCIVCPECSAAWRAEKIASLQGSSQTRTSPAAQDHPRPAADS